MSGQKTIITVQHTQSVHHTNRHAGAWGDWDLTEAGRVQAAEIGRYLLKEGCAEGYIMYASDLKRAAQTAEEISRVIGVSPVFDERLREINAGAGNGQPWEWFDAHKIPQPEGYDVDYRPFEDAESDRDLWHRLYPFYEKLLADEHERILVVSHGITLSFLQSMLMGQTLEQYVKYRFRGPSGAISRFGIDPQGIVTAMYINRTAG